MLDALGRCAFVLFKIAAGDPQAVGRAAEVTQASVGLLREYGQEDEWMSEGIAPEELAHGAESAKRYYVEDDEGHLIGEARNVGPDKNGTCFAYVRLFNMPECAEQGTIEREHLREKAAGLPPEAVAELGGFGEEVQP